MIRNVKNIMATVFGLEPQDIADEITADDVGSWDSMNHLRFITALEEEVSVQFSMDEIIRMKDLRTIVTIVTERTTI